MGIQKNSQAISPLNTFVLGKGKNKKFLRLCRFEFFDKGERNSGRSRGYGFVSFETAEDVEAALNSMNGVV